MHSSIWNNTSDFENQRRPDQDFRRRFVQELQARD